MKQQIVGIAWSVLQTTKILCSHDASVAFCVNIQGDQYVF